MPVINRLNMAGDTIIEVLFAVIVIGIVLTGSYGVVTRSVLAEEDAQQHTYALGLVQSQIEMFRSYYINKSPSSSLFATTPGCFSSSGGTIIVSYIPCVQALNSAENYTITITSNPSFIYTIKVSWPGALNTSANNVVSIPYRIQTYGG